MGCSLGPMTAGAENQLGWSAPHQLRTSYAPARNRPMFLVPMGVFDDFRSDLSG